MTTSVQIRNRNNKSCQVLGGIVTRGGHHQIMLDLILINIMMLNMLTGKFRCLPSGNDLPIPPCVRLRGHWLET